MKKWLFILPVILWAGHVSSSGQQEKLERILAKLEKEYDTFETVSCRFTQTKVIGQMEGEIRLKGKLYFKRPFFMRVELSGEENLRIYMDGRNIWLEDIDLEEVEIYDFEDRESSGRLRRLLPPFFLRGVEELEESFLISLLEEGGGRNRLQLIPREAEGDVLKSLQFDVDRWSRISWMKVEYKNGDWTETIFRNWERHPEISDHFFRYRGREF